MEPSLSSGKSLTCCNASFVLGLGNSVTIAEKRMLKERII